MLPRSTILVTGGAGYIGSHTCVKLLNEGHKVVILDNLSNSKFGVVDRITRITKQAPTFIEADVRDRLILRSIFKTYDISSVIHFAGLKAVGESESDPLKYYDNNVNGSVILFEEMALAKVKSIVFSSSATVYGDPGTEKYTENLSLNPVSVYGRTKRVVEDILVDIKQSDPAWRVALLRYFNPVGAHESGLIGEDPCAIPNNLMPYIAQVAIGRLDKLRIFGCDYPTPDGTGLRDYIHVDDLARGHLDALSYIFKNSENLIVNLGTGKPYSVIDVIKAFERASGKTIAYEFSARRKGDISAYYADPSRALHLLGWVAQHGLDRMCVDTWQWQMMNPHGY